MFNSKKVREPKYVFEKNYKVMKPLPVSTTKRSFLVRNRIIFSLKKFGLAVLIKKSAMEFIKSIIYDNMITRRDDLLA